MQDKDAAIWSQPDWIERASEILDSYRTLLGRELIERTGSAQQDAARLFHAPFVVVAHGTQADPILNYGNHAGLDLWEMDVATFTSTPSRETAEPLHREERARMMERTARDGYIDDYRGIRISATGRRFLIENAIVWNTAHADGSDAGQAATFDHWTML